MRIEETSQFLQANAVAQRVRQLILGAAPKVKTPSRQPTAIALAELKAGRLEIYDPSEAAEILAGDGEETGEEAREAAEAARTSFEQMFADGGGPMDFESPAPSPEAAEGADDTDVAEPTPEDAPASE